MIFYSKSTSNTNAAIGRLETPIKMIIEHESDALTKKGGICQTLFNIEKSSRFGETIVGESELDIFRATAEGAGAECDTVSENYKKFIEHIQFTKEFIISAEMMEDAQYGIAADAKRRAESFTRAYYKTMNKICESALSEATNATASFGGGTVDLTTYDGLPLFHSYHSYGDQGKTQCNYYYGDIFSRGSSNSRVSSVEQFEKSLTSLSIKLRSMKDENGEALGYNADTLILPGNKPVAESIVKKLCGTYGNIGESNTVNLHYGNWNIVILPNWRPFYNCVMVMSSEANKNLSGNMFFNRVPLTVTNWVDNHTGNYIWNGRCRFGVGFGTYKHILLAVDSDSPIDGATLL